MLQQPTQNSLPKENIIFLHLPKTAGTTLNFILSRQYDSEIIHTIEGDTLKALKKFENFTPKARQKIHVVNGHGEFGIHKFLFGPSKYITFLRNPIERVISDYYFILRAPQTPYHRYVTENQLSLKEAVECKDPLIMLPNSQTILLAGVWRKGIKQCNDEVLTQAKQNLRKHFIVGLTEKFDESICLLKSYFDWGTDVYYKKRNVTTNRLAPENLPKETLDAIVHYNQCDLELYKYGQALFAEQIKQIGPFFPARVQFYKAMNKAHEYAWFLQLLHIWHAVRDNWLRR